MFRTTRKIIKYTLLFYISLYTLVWVLSPTVIRYFLSDYLEQQQLVLSSDSSIRYNPFLSYLNIQELSVAKAGSAEQAVFSLKSLELELRFYQLLFDEIHVSEFIIDGLYLNVKKLGESLEVAGVALPLTEEASTPVEGTDTLEQASAAGNNEADAAKDAADGESDFPYKLDIPELTLKNSVVELVVDESPHRVKLKSFVITDFGATLAAQSLLLAIDSEVNQSSLSLDVTADLKNGDGKVHVNLDLTKIELAKFKHFLPESITTFEGQASYSGEHTIELGADHIMIEWPKLSLLVENVLVAQNDITVALAKKRFDSSTMKLTLNTAEADQPAVVEGTAQLALDDFKAFYHSEEQLLSTFKQLVMKDIVLSQQDAINKVTVDSINLSDALFSDNLKDDIPALAQFSLLGVNKVALTEKGISVLDINLSGLAVDAQLSKDKVLLNLVDVGEPTEAESVTTETSMPDEQTSEPSALPSEKTEDQFSIALGEFKLGDDAHIHFTDNSVKPVYERHFIITTLEAGPFDNQLPDNESLYNIVGRSDKYANFEFSGSAKPFALTPVYHLKGFFKEVSLPGVSAYIKEALQYEIQSGQLDLGLDVTLEGTMIDGEADVLLRGIELTAADDHEVGTVNDHSSVPFNVALGMLKDSDGNVELTLPLSGDTSSPSFGLSGFMTLLIQKATLSAAQDYLITTFVPYASVVKVAIVAGEFALKVRVNDLVYPAGEVALQPEHEVFLKEFAALMKDKEDVNLRLCAVATAADIGKPTGTPIVEKSDIDQLKAISNQRVHNFKDYMVQKEKIGSSRLLLCTPQVNSDADAKPSLTFST